MQVIKTSELPRDIQALIQSYDFNVNQVRIDPVVDFVCPTSYCDYNIMTVIAYNQNTGDHKAIRSGHYECHMNWTTEENALYKGNIKTIITDPTQWFIVLDTYPKHRVTVFCHPLAIAKALDKPKVELTKKQELALFIIRSMKSFAREEEARSFKIGKQEWATLKAELYGLGFLTKAGSLTIAGQNRAQGLMFYTYNWKA